MSISEELKNIKLKKVETKVGRGGSVQIISSTEEQTQLMDKVSFKKYYPFIKPYTFKSTEFQISDDEIKVLITEGKKVINDPNYVDWHKNETLISLGKKIEHQIFEIMKCKAGFIRFNTLSPKDGIFSEPYRLSKLFKEATEFLDQSLPEDVDFKTEFNRKIYALYIASTNGMKVEKGMDGIRLLVHSKRTLHELEKFVEGELKTRPHMICREFANFDVQYEFRAFVYKKKYCCCSQYNPYCFFPVLKKTKDEVDLKIRKFLEEKVLGDENIINISNGNFIVDIVIVGEEVKIVELNPYGEFAGSCLFDWSISTDFDILTGKSGFEFRIMEDVPPLVEKRLEKNWMRILNQ